jgi:putative spermidine/putrescine transport system ATP-binding protein
MSKAIDVELKQVKKMFGSNVVVNDFNLQIQEGECISFLGPSGCGKTTTLNMIAGFLEADSGEILIKGKRMNGVPSNKRELGMVFQTYSLFPHMTVAENVEYGLKLRKVPKAERKQRVQKALELVKLPQVADRYPKQLSGGQRQRIAIARALVIEPSLLLLDEPLSNLDAKLREELREEIRRLHSETGVTTIFVTHDQEEALYLSDRIVVLSNGRVEQIGTPLEIYNRPATEFVHTFIGKSNKLSAVLEGLEDGMLSLRTEAGFTLKATVKGQTLSAGSAVSAYIRPEKLRLAAPGDAHGTYSAIGRVRQSSFLGAFAECDIEIGSAVMTARIQTAGDHASLKPGDEIALEWNPEDVFVFPREER